jgi:hypothetical protein
MTARAAAADTLTLMWDPSPDTSVAGYLVYVGTQSGVYGTAYDVGNMTSFAYPSAAAGQPYYFAVAAYFPGPVIGARSTEVWGTTNASPVLANPGNQSSVVGSPVSLQLQGSDPAGQTLSYGVTALPPGLAVNQNTGAISGTPTASGSYLVTAVVSDGVLNDAETFTWTVSQPVVTDTNPTVTITTPTVRHSYNADGRFVTIGGTARDDNGITQVTWSSDRGGNGSATGTDTWIAGIPLVGGQNRITVTARDAAGNAGTATINVRLPEGKAK